MKKTRVQPKLTTSFHQAREQILAAVGPLDSEMVPLLEATGRAVAENIVAEHPLPSFDNSAMDGYAARTVDCTAGAVLPVIGYQPAGSRTGCRVAPGSAVKIMTGAPIPAGADAVIPFEETEKVPEGIKILGRVGKGDHVRRKGEDVARGDRVIKAGSVVRPAEICLLASLGRTHVPVRRRVRVAILSTGDELRELEEGPGAGMVINSNSWALAAAVREIGGTPLRLGIARDDKESLLAKLREGLQADVLITSAGVSAGDRDFVREALEELGVRQQFWGINIKPGKPTAFGIKDRKPVFSLPGNPVSAMITFEEFVRPALLKMMGHRFAIPPLFRGRLQEAFTKKPGRMQLMRVSIKRNDAGELLIASSGDQNTGILRTLVDAQGIALLDADREHYAAGEMVDLHFVGDSIGNSWAEADFIEDERAEFHEPPFRRIGAV